METDDGHSRQSSHDYDYTVDGGIPDAQFDEAMDSFLDDALEDGIDDHRPRYVHEGLRNRRANHEEDSDYLQDSEGSIHYDSNGDEQLGRLHASGSDTTARRAGRVESVSRRLSPSKRPQADSFTQRPFKRKFTDMSVGYLDLLNKDIREAALRGCTEDKDLDSDGRVACRTSQLGLTIWSAVDKRVLYEMTSRLGRTAVAEISAALDSKSVVEVEDYLNHLHYASEERKSKLRPILQTAEQPAAIELSAQCCHALDQAADTLSILQERKEQKREERKWGSKWLLTQAMYEDVSEQDEEHQGGQPLDESASKFGDLFDIPTWLKLSSEVFMNSAVPGNNWTYVDDEPPGIWATAMEDFRSLVVSITRRLVQTTIFNAMSRLRSKQEAEPRILSVVRREDVEAALQSLNMEDKRSEFWRGAARRLRLNVQDNDSARSPKITKDGNGEEEFMSFHEVETALTDGETQAQTSNHMSQIPSRVFIDDYESAYEGGGVTENEADTESAGPTEDPRNLSAEELAVRQEAEEVILYSGVDFPTTTRSKEVLLNRISSERRQEEYANRCDEQASRLEEVKIWDLLEKPVPQVLRIREPPEQLPRTNLGVDGVYSVGRNWRKGLHYVAEWETLGGKEGEEGEEGRM